MSNERVVEEVPNLRIDVVGEAARPLVLVAGEIDVATAPVLRTELLSLIDRGAERVTLDLSGVAFIDSSGLGVLVGALRRLREVRDGELSVDGVQGGVRKIFEITGLAPLFRLDPHERSPTTKQKIDATADKIEDTVDKAKERIQGDR